MESDEVRRRALSFGAVAGGYAEHRPGYPEAAARWLTGGEPSAVLEVGAGTGKLTQQLLAIGHDVVALDPLPAMLAELRSAAPSARPVVGSAESLPIRSGRVTTVVVAQAFHWFDREAALAEFARVLRPGGTLALVWNLGDFSVPWVRRAMSLIKLGPDSVEDDPLHGSELFEPVERRAFRHWQQLDRESLIGFMSSSSAVAVMSEKERDDAIAEAGWLFDEFGRVGDGLLMPWNALCFTATVRARPTSKGVGAGSVGRTGDDGLRIRLSPQAPTLGGRDGDRR